MLSKIEGNGNFFSSSDPLHVIRFSSSNFCIILLQNNTGMETVHRTAKLSLKHLWFSTLRATIILANESHVLWELSFCKKVANNSFSYSH